MKKYLLLMLIPMISAAADNQQFEPLGHQGAQPKRDPFTTSDKMHAHVGMQSGGADGYGGFIPGYGSGGKNTPKMRLRGFVTKNVSKATALLEIGGQVFMVSKGDEIGLHAIGAQGVLKVIDVGPNGVKVQAGRVNQVIIIR